MLDLHADRCVTNNLSREGQRPFVLLPDSCDDKTLSYDPLIIIAIKRLYSGCDHLSGKPGNVRDFTKSQGSVREKSSQGKVA